MPSFEPFVRRLHHALHGPLPGPAAQFRMAPRPRSGSEIDRSPPPDARRGGVLILFYPKAGELTLPLILRATYAGTHSGQMGFPGGGHEEIDADLVATALREAYEEIHVQPDQVTILGQLTPLYITPSNFAVTPTVGWSAQPPAFRIDPYEVAKLVEVPLVEIRDPNNATCEAWLLRNQDTIVPFFTVQGEIIWGATAMILSELLALLDAASVWE